MLTDGRVVTGNDAVKYGLIDEVGTLDGAIAKAKSLANIDKARIISYSRKDEPKGSAYAAAEPPVGTQINLINMNMDAETFVPVLHPQFLYMWTGQ